MIIEESQENKRTDTHSKNNLLITKNLQFKKGNKQISRVNSSEL